MYYVSTIIKVLGVSKFDTGNSKMTGNTTNLNKCCVNDMSKYYYPLFKSMVVRVVENATI
jgi:hypothetical protein